MNTQVEIRQRITDQVVAALRAGTRPPWVRPWANLENTGHPVNVSGRHYSGVNVLSLMLAGQERGYHSKHWGTFNQWRSLGFQVQRRPDDVPPGEWGVRAILFKPVSKTKKNVNGEDEEEHFMLCREFCLFNAEQVTGPGIEQYQARPRSDAAFVDCERAERVIFGTGAKIRHGGTKAVYHPLQDFIELPPKSAFRQPHEYYGTAAHETVHWSGHESRLARLNKLARFGDESYAIEELVAELGSAFLLAELAIPQSDDLTNVSAYLASWLKVLESDFTAIFTASTAASRAVDFILALTEAQSEAKEDEAAVTVAR